ncbi:hypothetical protein D8674_024424 [Pyrus ussuriensis x Pyrus communis]|uniref:Retrovirus-related Pol polyprotein from transposon TNT 1-94 n=1 Tax=Pyrus ussuriensis x Pyrus communis TaxID=2448454 RepID=A0A5N5H7Y3_9ROSA|nr:hypothetical protein D8674_024424 [Pyrus ussuriensis x Pyrus communis]
MAGSGGGELRAPSGYRAPAKDEELTEAERKLLRENVVKDARALGIIQGAVSDQIFPRIATQESAKAVWDILKQKFVGDKQVRSVKLQGLRRDFEYTRMNDSESLSVYIAKLFDLINQMKSYENTKDLDTIDAQDVVAILKGYEQRLDRHGESSMEKAFASLKFVPKSNRFTGQPNSNKYHKNFKPKEKQWSNKGDWSNKDSGCSNHMTSREDLLVDIDRKVKAKVQVGTGVLVEVEGKGTLIIETIKGRRYIKEVMLVPGLAENLLSVGQMTEHGYFLLFGDYKVDVFDDRSLQNLVVSVKQKGNRCFPLILNTNKELALRTNVQDCVRIWHKRFGHLNFRSLKLLQSQEMVLGLPEIQDSETVCQSCALGKNHREPFPKESMWRAKEPLELIHSDVCGPMQTSSLSGNRYFITFIDDYSRILWCEAVNTSVYLLNRSPTKAVQNTTPFEKFSGRKPGVKHLKVFGSVCYSLIPGNLRHKLEETSVMGVFIGYGTCEKGYRVLNPLTQKVLLSRDVIFDENGRWDWEKHKVKVVYIPLSAVGSSDLDRIDELSEFHEQEGSDGSQVQAGSSPVAAIGESSNSLVSSQYDNTPLRYRNLSEIYERCRLCIVEPESFDEAAQDEAWKKAMKDEMNMIEKNQTWELVRRPSNKPVIGVKWVTLIALAAKNKWKLFQLDVKLAFLNGVLEEEVYVEQPDGFVVQGEEEKVYRLHKALYGLKQAPRAWYGEIDSYLMLCGFKKSISEATLYTKYKGDTDLIINCKSVHTPLVPSDKLRKEDGSGNADEAQYRQIVGSLLYLTATRPDIMYVAYLLARFMHCPTNKHYGTAKRVLRYVQGTLDFGLEYKKGEGTLLMGYCDSDWSGSEDDMKSTSGYAFTFGNGIFSWSSVKQQCVALSAAEAEYISASEATAQATWLRFVLEDFGEMQTVATPMNCDNTSAIVITKNPIFHQKTKHINRRYHFIKEALQQGVIDLIHCPTKEQLADIFTKALAREQFTYLRNLLGVKSVHNLKGEC